MEGKARVELLERQIKVSATHGRFTHYQKDGEWIKRDDVWIKFLDRKGDLTVGYGSPDCIGPELEFGWVVGDHYDQQVLLIKTAWGGKDLYRDFRPPSAGLPDAAVLQKDHERARKNKPAATLDDIKASYGDYYRRMISNITNTLANLKENFPGYHGQGYELAGCVWFQGWNDMINPDYTAAYTTNMIDFIRDVRSDLHAPKLPFVIGVMGVDGREDRDEVRFRPNIKIKTFKRAQEAAADLPEFKGNVAVVETDVYWDMAADAVFHKGWKEHLEEWNQVGSNFPYHYLGSPKTYCAIGGEFARACIAMDEHRPYKQVAAAASPTAETNPVRFDPVQRNIEGWNVDVEPALLDGPFADEGSKALTMLANHLQRIKILVPPPQLEKLQSVGIWIEHDHPFLKSMQYHPGREWLVEHGCDPRLAKKVHITQARELYSRQQMLKHPAVVLHELAHAYHDQFLGFDDPEIVAAYDHAKASGIYENVLLYTGEHVRHYGLTDAKEYFAEGTEAYFYRNDFFPFVRAELAEFDPQLHSVLEKVWGPAK